MNNDAKKIIIVLFLVCIAFPLLIILGFVTINVASNIEKNNYDEFEKNISIVIQKVKNIKQNNEQYLGVTLGTGNNEIKYQKEIKEIIELYGIDITDNDYYILSNGDKIIMGISSLKDVYVVNYNNGLVFDLNPITHNGLKYYTSYDLYRSFNNLYAYDLPIIPIGFKYIEGNWNSGYVIADNYDNEFVWIPVGILNKENPSNAFKAYYAMKSIKNVDSEEYSKIITSINKYGGYYIARYEMSLQGATAESSIGTKNVLQSKKGVMPVTQLSFSTSNEEGVRVRGYNEEGKSVISTEAKGALELANKMAYDYNWVEYGTYSTIMYAEHYDTAVYIADQLGLFNSKTVNNLNSITEDSTNTGNYMNSSFKYLKNEILVEKNIDKGILLPTGSILYLSNMNVISNMNNLFNIYDLSGNVAEWVIQGIENEYRYVRGGSYVSSGKNTNISEYVKEYENFSSASIGMRVVLYMN